MQIVSLQQGSPEWLAHRAQHFNASDAPAMMGCSPYKTRAQLLHELHTGVSPEVAPYTQRIFDNGHRFEALARPLAEAIVGEELYPVVGTRGRLSASFDGLTMMEDVAFEHKTLNDTLRAAMHPDCVGAELPMMYQVQMEHQCIVSGATRALFMASTWNDDNELVEERHCWYESNPALAAQIVAGWEQFGEDLDNYQPTPAPTPAPVGNTPDTLPALRVEVTGMVTASNLDQFKATALSAIRAVNRKLDNDQDFADAAESIKWCKEVEQRLKAAKDHALSQTETIDALFKTIDDLASEAAKVRIELEKLVKARKDGIRDELLAGAIGAFKAHIEALNARIGKPYMPLVPADFGGAIKNKKTLDSLRNAVDTELARVKAEANTIASKLETNLTTLRELASGFEFLLYDEKQLVLKASDDLVATVKARMAEHHAAEKQREQAAATMAAQVVQQVAAKPPAPPTEALTQAAEDAGQWLKLGDINARLAPVKIDAAGLAQLGFEPVEAKGAAKLYREADFPTMCVAIVQHLESIMATA